MRNMFISTIQTGHRRMKSCYGRLTASDESKTHNGPQHSTAPDPERQKSSLSPSSQRSIRIAPEYVTDHLWLDPADPAYDGAKGVTVVQLSELAAQLRWTEPLKSSFQAWVDTYNEQFRVRYDEPGDFDAEVFPTPEESVAWLTVGFLLGWKIACGPDVNRVVYDVEGKEYVLRKDE